MPQLSSLRGGRGRKFKAEINVVPYIDVMLVLLVIFMVVAPLAPPSSINLPRAGQSTQPPASYIEIELKADGAAKVGLHGQPMKSVKNRKQLSEELALLHREQPELALMIAADKDIKYEEVVQAITEAKQSGIQRVGLATR
jgi:biopolymer transport protein TolR